MTRTERVHRDELDVRTTPEGGPTTPCQRAADRDLWFAESTADVELAKSLCRQCSLRPTCLTTAIQRREPWGVWGGEVFDDGIVVARKRGRGRPPKSGAGS